MVVDFEIVWWSQRNLIELDSGIKRVESTELAKHHQHVRMAGRFALVERLKDGQYV